MQKGELAMVEKATWRTGHKNGLVTAGIGALLMAMGGCAGDAPKPAPTMTQDQVRNNADKAFEKLKQEQRNRAGGLGEDPY